MDGRMQRVARGLVAAAFSLFVAAFSHVVAGGGAPAGAGLLLSIAFASMLCVLLSRRRPSLPALVVAVVLSQLVFHLLFGVGDGGGSGFAVTSVVHGDHVMQVLVADPVSGGDAHGHADLGMWAAHAVAAVVTVVAFWRGELAVRRLRGLARGVAVPAAVHAFGRVAAAAVRLARAGGFAGCTSAVVHAAEGLAAWGLRVRRAAGRWVVLPGSLRDLGVVFSRLRFRGPPAVAALHGLR
ncbi:hypothetical protein N1031_04380 [Herbiconiux moechotypicola]|uniref:Integral membrane protein n=1 Tax=Herbiconiux moechotypicola TaxID=637393 RepID=A0ABN3DA59_9MICO|nr:hypothetical protein [Herbiconiux moechotypicola]MCS5728987.1 hypothetical protein [Herbiconiux moechotypicola]